MVYWFSSANDFLAPLLSIFLGKLHFILLNYPPICTFTSKILNVTLYPPTPNFQIVTIRPFWHFFFQNAPITYFIWKKKIKNKKQKTKKKYAYITYLYSEFFYFFIYFYFLKNKICDRGILEEKKKSKWSNCNNLKIWGGKKCHV